MLILTERRILRALQHKFPPTARPYRTLARRLKVSEGKLISHVRELKKRGVIRYLSVQWNTSAIGMRSTLVAMRVPERKLQKVAAVINACPFVSHNYLREGEYNLWFTLTAPARRLPRLMAGLIKKTGVNDFLDLRTEKTYKISAVFPI